MIVSSCAWCGKTMILTKYQSSLRKYCSHKCYSEVPRKHTKETKEKISKANNHKSIVPCCVCGKSLSRQRCHILRFKRFYCPGCKSEGYKKFHPVMRKEKHPAWKGGRSFLPYDARFDARLKSDVRERDGYKCRECGAKEETLGRLLHVHHVDYDKQRSVKINLISLCQPCHLKTYKKKEYWHARFEKMLHADKGSRGPKSPLKV